MLKFPTRALFIEGPDCSGKTTLVKKIHRISNYEWHIQDRSQISRKIFSDLYHRDIDNIDSDLHVEISNLNNRFILLLPEIGVVNKRFLERGDDFHKDLKSLGCVYDIFKDRFKSLRNLPNTMFYSRSEAGEIASVVLARLHIVERCMIREVSDQVLGFVECNNNESYPLEFTLYDDGEFEEANEECLDYEPESNYYHEIFRKLHTTISDELSGKNEYNRVESSKSRRFIYTDNTCISFIQVSIRDRVMDFHTVIRSTDVKNIFPHDLMFLYYLAYTCYNRFKEDCDNVRMRFNLNSSHIIG
jgi:hypothetical protein